jgi:hypothetical protein
VQRKCRSCDINSGTIKVSGGVRAAFSLSIRHGDDCIFGVDHPLLIQRSRCPRLCAISGGAGLTVAVLVIKQQSLPAGGRAWGYGKVDTLCDERFAQTLLLLIDDGQA